MPLEVKWAICSNFNDFMQQAPIEQIESKTSNHAFCTPTEPYQTGCWSLKSGHRQC